MVRFKNRYLLVELIWKDGRIDETLTEANIQSALRDSIAINFGDYGLGTCLTSLQVKYYNPLTNLSIVRCGREQYQEVLASMTTITTLRYRTLMMHLLHNGGTLASCQRAAIEHNKAVLQRMRLTKAQQKLASEAEDMLQALEL